MNTVDPLEAVIAQSNDVSIKNDTSAIISSLEDNKDKAIEEALNDHESESSDTKHKKQKKNFKTGPSRTVSIPLPKGSMQHNSIETSLDPISTFNEEKVEYKTSEREVYAKETMSKSWFKRHEVCLKYTGYTFGIILLILIFAFIGYKFMLWYKRRKYSNILTENEPKPMRGMTGGRGNIITIKDDTTENTSWSNFNDEKQPDYDINVNRDISNKYLEKDNKSNSSGSMRRDARGRFVKRK